MCEKETYLISNLNFYSIPIRMPGMIYNIKSSKNNFMVTLKGVDDEKGIFEVCANHNPEAEIENVNEDVNGVEIEHEHENENGAQWSISPLNYAKGRMAYDIVWADGLREEKNIKNFPVNEIIHVEVHYSTIINKTNPRISKKYAHQVARDEGDHDDDNDHNDDDGDDDDDNNNNDHNDGDDNDDDGEDDDDDDNHNQGKLLATFKESSQENEQTCELITKKWILYFNPMKWIKLPPSRRLITGIQLNWEHHTAINSSTTSSSLYPLNSNNNNNNNNIPSSLTKKSNDHSKIEFKLIIASIPLQIIPHKSVHQYLDISKIGHKNLLTDSKLDFSRIFGAWIELDQEINSQQWIPMIEYITSSEDHES